MKKKRTEKTMSEKSTTVVDPVCGMTIDPTSAAGSAEYEGRTYYFCSNHCVESFKADPAKYASAGAP
jgi:Cu+-exporting ATPase